MLTLLASISAHLSVSQNIESGKSHELQVDEYRFPLNSFDKNFSLDTMWSNPEARLHGEIGRKRFKSGERRFKAIATRTIISGLKRYGYKQVFSV